MVSQAESAAQPEASRARRRSMAPLKLAVRRGAGANTMVKLSAEGGDDASDWPGQNVDYKENTDDGEGHKSPRYEPPVELNFD
ncbi:hypothetical protein ZWY2020_000666 [Hordeum vulgare]|nr:hypothetical protein ZWY2020_000666 [Hordeum vulgare]